MLPYWVCNMAKKYMKMCYIDKLFPKAVWPYNYRVFGIKMKESKSKLFVHCALEVWSALYHDKLFGSDNKNIISYSMAAMVYAKIELKRKVDSQTILTKNKKDRTEYAKTDIPENFNFFRQNIGDGPIPHAHASNRNTLRSKKSIQDGDFVGKTIFFEKNKSCFEDKEGVSTSKKLDNTLSRLEGDI